ncbi:MAG: hypothetical protein LAT81_16550 [Oceanicaulis sp.]|nr:hypothetical protein [Oceanicaulis sp.]
MSGIPLLQQKGTRACLRLRVTTVLSTINLTGHSAIVASVQQGNDMFRGVRLGGAAALMVAGVAHAAEIRLEGKNVDGVSVVSISGDFIERDIERFADVTKDLDDAIISFSSDGGALAAGIEIGTRIRLRGYRTVVADQEECYSACALAWLGGTTRYVGSRAQIGFHAAYIERDGRFQETGSGNAVVGGYAANLGLRTQAIIFLTSAPPEGFNQLTEALAQRVGIAAEFGDTRRMVLIPTILTNGGDIIPAEEQFQLGLKHSQKQDYAEAMIWFRRAAEQEHAVAQFYLGNMYLFGRGVDRDYSEAVHWYRLAAEQGDSLAQKELGRFYLIGRGVPQDHAEAVIWFRRAAEQGNLRAHIFLGNMYELGQGGRQDYAEAVHWYRLAAEQGDSLAQQELGYMYMKGRGVRQDYSKALHLFRNAADQGHAGAKANLGFMYRDGLGVRQYDVLAHMWWNLAVNAGSNIMRLNLDEIERRMSPSQIAEAQRLAREWKPSSK